MKILYQSSFLILCCFFFCFTDGHHHAPGGTAYARQEKYGPISTMLKSYRQRGHPVDSKYPQQYGYPSVGAPAGYNDHGASYLENRGEYGGVSAYPTVPTHKAYAPTSARIRSHYRPEYGLPPVGPTKVTLIQHFAPIKRPSLQQLDGGEGEAESSESYH